MFHLVCDVLCPTYFLCAVSVFRLQYVLGLVRIGAVVFVEFMFFTL